MKRWGKWLGLAAVIVALLPLLRSLSWELFRRTSHPPFAGDFALLELGVRRALHGAQLVGPYSRYGWSHPGPLYFYVVAPFYALSQRSETLHLVPTIVGTASVIAALWIGARLVTAPLHRAIGLVLFAWWFHGCLRSGWSPDEPWNPAVTILPSLALFFVAAWVARPKTRGLAALVVLHAYVVQTHLGNGPLATALLLSALSMRWFRARSWKREVGVVALTMACMWSLPIIDELRGQPGNLTQLARFFRSPTKLNPALHTVGYSTQRIVHPYLRTLSIRNGLNLLVAIEIALIFCVRRGLRPTWAADRKDAARFSALVAIALPVAFLASTRIRDELASYLTPAYPMLLPLAAFALAWSLLPKMKSALPFGLALIVLASYERKGHGALAAKLIAEAKSPEALDAQEFVDVLAPALRGSPDVRFTTEGDAWATQAAVVLGLEKLGISPVLDPRWAFQFGKARYSGPTVVEIVIHEHRLPQLMPVRIGRTTSLSLRRAPKHFGRASVRASTGTTGDPVLAVDGDAAIGSQFDAPTSVLLAPNGSLTVDLLGPDGAAREALGVHVTADQNDTYRIEGSHDGVTFQELGYLSASSEGAGMRGRDFYFLSPYSVVRVSPGRGDGLYAISEIAPIYGRSALDRILFGTPGARPRLLSGFGGDEHDQLGTYVWAIGTTARCELHLEEGRACTVRLETSPFLVPGRSQSLTIETSDTRLTTFSFAEEVSNYSFELPANAAHSRTELTFRFAYATAPHDIIPGSRDTRPLAATFRILEVCPGVFTADDLR